MMMEQCGYGMAMGGYPQVPEYIDGYPVSPFGGSIRERAEDAGQGVYEPRGIDNCWDRMSNESGCKSSGHSTTTTNNNNSIPMDDSYIQNGLSIVPGRGGGGGYGGGRGRGRGQGGRGDGVTVAQLSPNRPTLEDVEAGEGDACFEPHPTGHHLQPTRVNAVDDQYPSFVDWRDFAACPGQYYSLHEVKKYGEVGHDFGERTVQSVTYLPQPELYDCPPVAAAYPTGLYPVSGQALPFCHPSPPGTTVMSEGWQGGSSVASDETLVVEEAEKRRNPYRAAAAAALTSTEPSCSGHRSQVARYPSTSSSSLSSSRRGSGVAHAVRKQGASHHNHHQRRWHSDLSDTFLDDDERKLRERDRKKKDNHNLIERKRRLNINANIQVLGTLLPPSSVSLPKDSTQNKGNILRATVEFVQSAQQKIERLQLVEHSLRDVNANNRRLKCTLKELETFLRSAGLYEDYLKTVGGDKDYLTRSSPVTFDVVKEEMNYSPSSLQRQESDVTDDCTGG